MKILFILFVLIPIIEMWLLIEVGSHIGALNTIGLVLLTAFIGVVLLRQQGINTLLKARQRLDRGQIPAREMVDGLFLGIAGALLLTPGFFTDTVGFICLVPGARTLVIVFFCRHIQLQTFKSSRFTMEGSTAFTDEADKNRRYKAGKHRILEGEIDNDDKTSN